MKPPLGSYKGYVVYIQDFLIVFRLARVHSRTEDMFERVSFSTECKASQEDDEREHTVRQCGRVRNHWKRLCIHIR